MTIRQTPPQYVIDVFGGVRKTARALGRDPGGVSRWKKRRRIPSGVHKKILAVAKRRSLDISASDLIYGR